MPSLARNFKEVHSIDLDTRALKYVKDSFHLNNVNIAESTSEKLPYPDEYFDLIFAADVLEHFRNSFNIQKEFKRVLKKNGYLIISGPTENLLYQLARKFLYKRKKPKDHFTDVFQVMDNSKKLFKIDKIETLPIRAIPGFKIYLAKK